MAYWTKRNVLRMNTDELIYWKEKSLNIIKEAQRLEMEVPSSEKAYKLVISEMKKRGMM